MERGKQLSKTVETFITDWVDQVNENPTIVLGEWLYAFGAMSALALKSQQLTQEQFKDASDYLTAALDLVYQNTENTFIPTKMQ